MARREKLIHIKLSEAEEKIIKENAARLNMKVHPYIRMVAQNPTIIKNNYSAIEEHTKQIGMIVNSINQLIFTIKITNNYQPKEIDGIMDYTNEIMKTERKLLAELRKQWTKQYKQNRK